MSQLARLLQFFLIHGPDLAVNCGDQPWGNLRTPAPFRWNLCAFYVYPFCVGNPAPRQPIFPSENDSAGMSVCFYANCTTFMGGLKRFLPENADRSPRAFFAE